MYARTTTVHGDPGSLDEAIDYLRRRVMPAIQALDGYVGLSMLCDRDTGRSIATTAWATRAARDASATPLHALRQRYAEMMGGGPEVEEWEIGALHRVRRAPEGAGCRVIWSRGDPAESDRLLDAVRMVALPRLEELPGFCSMSLLLDRAYGRTATAVVYESRETMRRAGEEDRAMREQFDRELGISVTEMGEFELALAHLRVPETV